MKSQDKTLIAMILVVIAQVILVVWMLTRPAEASITCGIKPIPPVNCYAVCTSTGWVYICD